MQDISNTLWAYATLRHYPGAELLDGAARQAVSTIYRFKPQEVANTLWSYATLGHDPKNLLLDAMAAQMAQRILHFRPQVAAVSQVSAFIQVVPFRDSFCPLQRQVLSLSETVFVPFRDSFCPLQRQLRKGLLLQSSDHILFAQHPCIIPCCLFLHCIGCLNHVCWPASFSVVATLGRVKQ